MPIVELDIGGTPTKVQVSDGYTPEDLDHIAKTINAPIGPAATTDTPTSGVMGAVSQGTRYVGRKALEWQKAADTMLGGLQSTAPPDNPPTDPWDIAGQTATALGPAVAGPEATALGLTAGAYTRMKGGDEQTADLANAGVQLGTGLARGTQAAAGLKGAISARFGRVADTMAQRGTQLAGSSPEGQALFWDLGKALGKFNPGGVEGKTAKAVMKELAQGGRLTYGDLDNALTAVQDVGGGTGSKVAGLIRNARDALTAGTPEARDLAGGYRASKWARTLPKVLRGAAGTSGLAGAGFEAYRGNYGRAASALALGATGAGASLGHALAVAGPLARTGIGAAGTLAPDVGDLGGGGGGGDETQPADIGTAGLPATETPPPSPASPSARIQPLAGPYGREIAAVASLVKIPPELIQVQMHHESSDRPGAVSNGGWAGTPAYGLMQITPGTFKSVAKEAGSLLGRAPSLDNPFDNILAGGLLMKRYLDRTDGDVGAALKMYHGGENPAAWGPRTEQYSQDITNKYAARVGG